MIQIKALIGAKREKGVNMYKINTNRKSYTVEVKPDMNGKEKSMRFGFNPYDAVNKELAFKEAVTYRDENILISETTTTGYVAIEVKEYDGNIVVETSVSNRDGSKADMSVSLDSNTSYKEALRTVINHVCSVAGINPPTLLVYDYGLAEAYRHGYKGHEDDIPKDKVNPKKRIGDKVRDPLTGDIGTIVRIHNDVTYMCTFEVGLGKRLVEASDLLKNILTEQHNIVMNTTEKLKDETLTNEEIHNLSLTRARIGSSMHDMYRVHNNNVALPDTDTGIAKAIKSYKPIGFSMMQITKKNTGRITHANS